MTAYKKLYMGFGLVIGLFLAFAGLLMVTTHVQIQAQFDNPFYQVPILGPVLNFIDPGNAVVEGGLSVEGLGQVFLTALVTIMALGLFVTALLMFILRGPEMLANYAFFAIFLVLGFILTYFMGLIILEGALNV